MTISAYAAAILLAVVHLFVHRMKVLDTVPRSRWLSLAGGASLAYVFLLLLPELSAHQAALAEDTEEAVVSAEIYVYAVALLGVTVFYGLERMVRTMPAHRSDGYRIHLASFALYNAIVGYLLIDGEREGILEIALFAFAMGFHFLTVDFGLRLDHKHRFERWGRFVLAGFLLAGVIIGAVVTVPEWLISLLFGFLAGGVILNVMKEELPEERRSRFLPFLLGVVGYGVLLVLLHVPL